MDLSFENYEKISDIVMNMGFNTVLKMNVVLGRKNKDGKRIICHREYKYGSNKYTNCNNLVSITRIFDYYLSIETFKDDKNFIMIRDENIILLRTALQMAVDLMSKEIFGKHKGKLCVLNGSYEPILINSLPMGKSIRIEPIPVRVSEVDELPGFRIYLNSLENYVDMTYQKFMGFVYNINSIYLYASAQNLLNYIQRPALGTNLTTFDNRQNYDSYEDYSDGDVSIKSNNNKFKHTSIFDEIDDIGK